MGFIKNNRKNKVLVIKYGGNAMTDEKLQSAIIANIATLIALSWQVIIVHGGGPFINSILSLAGIESNFIDGHRKTTPKALRYIEMALRGQVNGDLIRLFNAAGIQAVGISGKDGGLVRAMQRKHIDPENGKDISAELGRVGDVENVNPRLLDVLLSNGFTPVISCLASDSNGKDFNINADMFAGHIAGALKADMFLLLTDVDGIMEDREDVDSLQHHISRNQVEDYVKRGILVGGMLPKVDACFIALEQGAASARIINGTKPEQLLMAVDGDKTGSGIYLT